MKKKIKTECFAFLIFSYFKFNKVEKARNSLIMISIHWMVNPIQNTIKVLNATISIFFVLKINVFFCKDVTLLQGALKNCWPALS